MLPEAPAWASQSRSDGLQPFEDRWTVTKDNPGLQMKMELAKKRADPNYTWEKLEGVLAATPVQIPSDPFAYTPGGVKGPLHPDNFNWPEFFRQLAVG